MTVGASFATGSVGLLVLPGRLLGPSGASAATVPVGAGFVAGGETGAGATVGGRVPAFGGAAFFLVRAGGRFALSLTFAFGFGRACFWATAFFFALIAVVFGRLFAADLARRNFALVLPLALAAFLTFALLAIVSSPPRWLRDDRDYWVGCKVASHNRRASAASCDLQRQPPRRQRSSGVTETTIPALILRDLNRFGSSGNMRRSNAAERADPCITRSLAIRELGNMRRSTWHRAGPEYSEARRTV